MQLDAVRARILVAMGLTTLTGCPKDKPETKTPDAAPSPTPTASASSTASAVPVASADTTLDAGNLKDPTALQARPVGHPTGIGGCGFSIVCRPPPGGAGARAAKPLADCAATLEAGTDPETSSPHRGGPLDEEQTQTRRKAGPAVCCYKAQRALCGGGRPLRSGEGPVVAAAVPRTDWMRDELRGVAALRSESLASDWLREAAFEHASVASFARASLQLLRLGAPADLVLAVHDAARDEIDHARTCFALAARRGATASGPDALPIERAPFATSIDAFVRDTFLDGCVAETIAALDVRRRSASPRYDEVERAALARIADDEERHADLAWRMLAWAVESGGEAARDALGTALVDVVVGTERGADDAAVVSEVVEPCARALLGPRALA